MTQTTSREDGLVDLGAPVWPPRPLTPLGAVASRALGDVAADLRALVRPADAELVGVDEEYLGYYHAELVPRLLGPAVGVDDRDVFDLGTGDGEHLVVVGTWRDTFFCHGLWFVAGLERSPTGCYEVSMFKRLRAPIVALRAGDLDQDGRLEVVLRTTCGAPGDGPPWHVHVVSRGGGGWTCSDLASHQRITALAERDRWSFTEGGSGRAWTWQSEGFAAVREPLGGE